MVSLYKYVHLPIVNLSAASQSCWHCVTSFPRQWLCLTLSLDIMQLEWISEDAIPPPVAVSNTSKGCRGGQPCLYQRTATDGY